MHVIYYCYGGAHSSVVAAAVHLGALDPRRLPEPRELLDLPEFDRMEAEEHGRLRQLGVDGHGHAVYILGARGAGPVVERALRGLLDAAGLDPRDFVFANTLRAVNTWMRVGGYLSRVLGWEALGRPLVIHGTRKAFPQIVGIVERVKVAVVGTGTPARRMPPEPRVVYYCYGGVHTSVVAAAAHLGLLPRARPPDVGEILRLPLFDRRDPPRPGRVEWLGRDERGVRVGVVGLGPCRRFAARTVREALRTLGAEEDRVLLVPVLERTGALVRVGGFIAQRLHLHALGARLAAWGIRRSYPRLAALVENTRRQAAARAPTSRRAEETREPVPR